jgi:hypothetical protein
MRATRHAPEPQEDEVTLTMTVTEAQHLRRTLAWVDVTDEARATVCDAYDALYALETQPARVHAQAKAASA